MRIRTDLALEVNEEVSKSDSSKKGIIVDEHTDKDTGIKVTTLKIINENGEHLLKRPKGTYITIEADALSELDDEYNTKTAQILAYYLGQFIEDFMGKTEKPFSILVVGLGNREVTADSLGPDVVENLLINRHSSGQSEEKILIAGLSPGVMAQTGMETAKIVKGIVTENEFDIVIAIDALAARNSKRLNTTIQLSDTGIKPGSGVGNHRIGITQENIGVPVIAIGVPTVIDAPTIVNDAIDVFLNALSDNQTLKSISRTLNEYTQEEKYQLIRELIEPGMADMYVTPKDVDANIKVIGYTLSEAINIISGKDKS